MALETLLDRILVDELLPSRVRAALGLADPASVYVGRRRRSSQQALEVLVLPAEIVTNGRPLTVRTAHAFDLVVSRRAVGDATGAGSDQAVIHGRQLDLIRIDLAGDQGLPWREEIPELFALTCRETVRDEQPDDQGTISGTLRLTLHTQGSGALLEVDA